MPTFRRARVFLSATVVMTATFPAALASSDDPAVQSREVVARVGAGTVAAHVSWVVDETTASDALRGRVEYQPDPDPGTSCRSIRFVQVARVQRNGGPDYEWPSGESDRNYLRTPRAEESGIRAGFFVDHRASACTFERPCSPYFRDSWANADESSDGYQIGDRTAAASLIDYPFGWETIEQISLESCARCVESGAFLGCADWGARWPRQGARQILPVRVHRRPSETFLAALNRFEGFYSAPAASR